MKLYLFSDEFSNFVNLVMLVVSQLFIYPIKSLGGISVNTAIVTDRGLQYDRRYMLVNEKNIFLTQREIPAMALLRCAIEADDLVLWHKDNDADKLRIQLIPEVYETSTNAKIWDDLCSGLYIGEFADKWFSDQLKIQCRLVYMPDSTRRQVNPVYAEPGDITSFSDAYPVLLIGQSSLDDLNSRLNEPLPMNRFRPNIVMAGGEPFDEDTMEQFGIGQINFFGVKLCDRCIVTTTNQETAIKGKEPLKTLATYRMKNNNVYFGQNVLCGGEGEIRVGDKIEIIKKKKPLIQ